MISRHSIVLLLVLLLGQLEFTQAQTIIEMETELESAEYVLDVQKYAEIGIMEPISPISLFSKIGVDEDGRILIGPTHENFEIKGYDILGEEETSFGRSGEGPGEFRRIQKIAIGNDGHVYLYDGILKRVSVFVGTQFLHSFNVPVSLHSILPVSDGRLLLQSGYNRPKTPDHRILLLHLCTSTGDSLLSFGPLESEYQFGRPWNQVRSLALAGDSEIWAGYQNRHKVELWTLNGDLEKVLFSNPEWFQPWEEEKPDAPWMEPPEPELASVQQDSEGRLWILSRVPSTRWTQLDLGGDHFAMPGLGWMNSVYDTVVEVIDPQTGKLLLMETLSGNRAVFIGDGLISEKRERSDGDGMVIIWKLSLSTR